MPLHLDSPLLRDFASPLSPVWAEEEGPSASSCDKKNTWVNIEGKDVVSDDNYRYRMPTLECEYEKEKWTVVTNLSEIAKALNRPAGELLKFMGVQCCTRFRVREGRYCLRGQFTASGLRLVLRHYIQDFVLCGQCRQPKTAYRVRKSGRIVQKCHACEHRTPLDTDHRLCTFILGEYKKTASEGRN